MLTRVVCVIALIVTTTAPALAELAEQAGKAVSDAFQKACSSGDIPGVMSLYEDDATVIWAGQGQFTQGKAGIKKLAVNLCKPTNTHFQLVSQRSRAIGDDYIMNVGRWEVVVPGPGGKPAKVEVRTTELLHRSAEGWRYAVDHASIGVPPPSAPNVAKQASD